MIQKILLFLILWTSIILAKPFQPPPTSYLAADVYNVQEWSARPTPPPSLELLKRRLKEYKAPHKRAAGTITSGQFLGFVAPDNTCGYDGGLAGAAISCNPGHTCFALAPIGSNPGAMGCFYGTNLANWDPITSCYGLAAVSTESLCDHECQLNTYNLLCTDQTAPYCYGYTYPQLTATNYICDTTYNTVWETVLTSWNGDTAGHSWTPLYQDEFGSSTAGPTPASSTSTPLPNPLTPTPPSRHSVPAGAIAGGVVGGILALGAIISAILFICLRKRGQSNINNNNNTSNIPGASEYNSPTQTTQVTDTKSQSPYTPQPQYPDNQGSWYSPPQQQFAQQQYAPDPMQSTRTSIAPPYSPQSPQPVNLQRKMVPSPTPMNVVAANQEPVHMAEMADGMVIPQRNREGERVFEAQG